LANEERLMYSIRKLLLGVVCLLLRGEYAWSYVVHSSASFGFLYIADSRVWFPAGFILFTKGLRSYLRITDRGASLAPHVPAVPLPSHLPEEGLCGVEAHRV
jgi:hypothetical protein